MPRWCGRSRIPALPALLALAAFVGVRCASPPPDIPVVPLDSWHYVEGRPAPRTESLDDADRQVLVDVWGLIQAGRLGLAELRLGPVRAVADGEPAVLATDGFLALRSGRPEAAKDFFARALAADAGQADAALGAALTHLDDPDPEVRFLHLSRLDALEPGAPIAAERLAALRPEVADLRLLRARALRREQPSAAGVTEAYRALLEVVPASSSGDIHIEAGEAAAAAGAHETALGWFDRAAELPGVSPGAALGARLSAAESVAAAGDALASLDRLDAILADPVLEGRSDLEARANDLGIRLAVARNREELARVREAERVTRGQLAAVLIAELGEPPAEVTGRDAVDPEHFIAVDLGSDWAADLIRRAVRSGYLSLFPDHTFKPRDFVSRTDLAESLVATLAVLDAAAYERAVREAGTVRFSDLPVGHRSRDAGAMVVGLGLLEASGGEFRPREFASGALAVRAVQALRDFLAGG